MTELRKLQLIDEDGNIVAVQHPLPTDGDSVYVKDLDIPNCDNGDFSGVITDYFDSLKTVNSNTTTDNPKIIKLWFKRTVYSHSIGLGCDNLTAGFGTSLTVKLLGSGEEVRYTKTFTVGNPNSFLAEFGPKAFNGIILEFNTTDEVCISNMTIQKAQKTDTTINGVSELTGEVENISTYRKAINVNAAWVHRKIVSETFYRKTGIASDLATPASSEDTSITVIDSTGFVTGDEIKICEGATQEIGLLTLTNVVGNVLTLDRPLANEYTTGLEVCQVESNMAVNGSLASPVSFIVKPPTGTVWQITRYLLSLIDGTVMDDGKFGGISSLTNGVVLKAITEAGRVVIFGNWKNNGDIKLDMYDVEYSDKAPAGEYGLRGRWTFTKAEVVAEVNGDDPLQQMEILIQDDLTANTSFRMKAQGRVFSP